MNYEVLIERNLEAIPAAARSFLESHSVGELWVSVTRFAVLAYAPSQHSKRAVMACRATYELRGELGDRWTEMIVACARYAAESRQPWSEPPILDPPEPSSGATEELRAAMADGDRLRGERWLAARLRDAEIPLRELAHGDAMLMLDTALALLPHLGEKGRYALLRMPVWELVTNAGTADPAAIETLLEHAVVQQGAPDHVQPVLAWSAGLPAAGPLASSRRVVPYPLARDYAQTLIAHFYSRRLAPAQAETLLDAVHHNLEHGENFAEWSFA